MILILLVKKAMTQGHNTINLNGDFIFTLSVLALTRQKNA
jgi:hypothetical protein